MFPKISSTNRRSACAILDMDLCSSERDSGVFMRGIRAPHLNLSENLGPARWPALGPLNFGAATRPFHELLAIQTPQKTLRAVADLG
jgi:hypothetical protein